MEDCIFCGKTNDGSDEHIIPDCINGRLHSKDIICHDCNSNKFGANIDPVVKELFSPFLTIWGIQNGQGFHIETPEGKKYLMSKSGETKQVKPEVDIVKADGKTEIRVTGDSKNAVKLFEKRKKEFLEKGYKELSVTQKVGATFQPPLSMKWDLATSPELILLINKIVTEFYAFSGLPIESISELRTKVNELDKTLKNVLFCNFNQEVREFEKEETSHIITIRNDTETEILFAYIELFNVVCAVIPLVENYKGDDVNITYRQDSISGERMDSNIVFKEGITNLLKTKERNLDIGFGVLLNKLSQRLREKEFSQIYKAELTDIEENLIIDILEERVTEDKYSEEFLKRSAEMIAKLSLYDFPYLIEDFKDEENEEVNYLHSNLNEKDFDNFCSTNSQLIGKEIKIENEGVFVFDSFYNQPFMEVNGVNLISVYCVLIEKSTGRKQYIPYRFFFEGISVNGIKTDSNMS